MVRHSIQIGGLIVLVVAGIFYPFFPGAFDPLALPISTLAQLLSAAGLVLMPVGGAWWLLAGRQRAAGVLAWVALGLGSALTLAIGLLVFFAISQLLGVWTLTAGALVGWRLWAGLARWRAAGAPAPHPAPLYLLVIPLAVAASQAALAGPVTAYSREYVIAQSADLRRDIAQFRARTGGYPRALLAVWQDYAPGLAGVERYYYAADDGAYNLAFEQPRLLFDNPGTREFVVYHPLDAHFIPSHVSWVLLLPSGELAAHPGWYAAHAAASPQWRYFWFD